MLKNFLLHRWQHLPFLFLLIHTLNTNGQQPAETSITALHAFAEPSISPDGKEIAFASGGDIWTVPATGGEARLLLSHPAFESRPLYSPNGRYVAFQSNRSGNGDIYVLDLHSNELRRLTYDDGNDELSAWSPDSRHLYFSSTARDIASMRDVFRIAVDGGTPMLVSDNRYISEFLAAPSPDGKTLALAARGFGLQQWWRKGRSHLDESEIWLMQTGNRQYQQLTQRGSRQLWPMWSPDGKTLFYVSDRNGPQNLWVHPIVGTAKQLTQFTDGRVLWPAIAQDGSTIVFERDFKIWTCNTATGEAKALAITRRGVPAGPAVEHQRVSSQFSNMTVSPDSKKVAFVAHGDVFVAAAKDGGDAVRITNTPAPEMQLDWTPNSNQLLYVSERNGSAQIFQYNFITGKETQLTSTAHDDATPAVAPDGKSVAFVRNGKELRILDLATGRETLVTKGYFNPGPFSSNSVLEWSPDSKWLAYAGFGSKSFRNVYVAPASGGEGRPVSFLANSFGTSVLWNKDGKSILFTTAQRTESGYVARVDLVPQQIRFKEEQFRELFTEQVPGPAITQPSPKRSASAVDTLSKNKTQPEKAGPVRVEWEGIRQRLSMLPLGVDVYEMTLSKDGKTLVVGASAAGQSNLYSYALDELSKEPAVLKQLTATAGNKNNIQITSDGKEVYYLEGGRIHVVALDNRQVRTLSITAELDVDFAKEKLEVFNQAWEAQKKGFYDTSFHGVDWQAVRRQYLPYAAGAASPDELRRLISLMLGELNASHSGISAPAAPSFSIGHLGLRFDAQVFEKEQRLRVSEVIDLGPASLAGGIKQGDYVVAVDGSPVTGNTNLDQLMDNKINKRVVLTASSNANGSNTKEVQVRPISQTAEKRLLYRQWVQQQRDYVTKISNGRLGYVHMFDMSAQSLDQLYLDMDAENHSRQGVVIDIRNNNGGFVNAYALDVFARRGYMNMTVRGLPSAPARVQLGQRALEAPTVLVINQHSLSDAEDFTEGYRTLGLGKVVGEPTAGWIIYTSSVQLLDGSLMRMPFIKITDNKGNNMELNPRPVDIAVTKPLGEQDKDAQLDEAVKVLLQQLEDRKELH